MLIIEDMILTWLDSPLLMWATVLVVFAYSKYEEARKQAQKMRELKQPSRFRFTLREKRNSRI